MKLYQIRYEAGERTRTIEIEAEDKDYTESQLVLYNGTIGEDDYKEVFIIPTRRLVWIRDIS